MQSQPDNRTNLVTRVIPLKIFPKFIETPLANLNKMDKQELLRGILTVYMKNMNLFQTLQINFDSKLALFRRRRRRNLLILQRLRQQQLLLLASLSESANRRALWKMNRTSTFWEIDCNSNGEGFFQGHFNMSRASFDILCILLHNLSKTDSNLRSAIPLPKRVAISLFTLCSSQSYRTISELFGVGLSTVCTILLEFCQEMWKAMSPRYLNKLPPTQESVRECVEGFQRLGFPQCLGVIDTCHIEVKPSSRDAVAHLNEKEWYSIVLMALVDYRQRFLYINVGATGSCSPSEIYDASLLKELLTEDDVLVANGREIGGVHVPVGILGDAAFPLSTTLMKPYDGCTFSLTPEQEIFNYNITECRKVAQHAFNHLKARFRRINNVVDNRKRNAPTIVRACCVLHNFLIEINDNIKEEWLKESLKLSVNREIPKSIIECDVDEMESDAEVIRRTLCHYMSSNANNGSYRGTVGEEASCTNAGGGDAGGGTLCDGIGVNNDGCDVKEESIEINDIYM